MKKVILVAESLQEWKQSNEIEELNEGAKKSLIRFIKDPSKKKSFVNAYIRQIGKVKGLKNALLKLNDDSQIKLAKQSYERMEKDPKLGYPWIRIENKKIIGGSALPVKKGDIGQELGQ